ncbi:hypothetical protein Tco_0660042, partial [Tanacetum coccineum]
TPPRSPKKFVSDTAIATRLRGYYKRGTRESVNGKDIIKIETSVIKKDGTITKYPGKFQGYKPIKEERKAAKLKEIYENLVYDISDSDSDLKSTAGSGPKDSEMEDTGGSRIRINA